MEPDDCPAAHSMDSKWYAVDEHSEVASFDTGEGGAMPMDSRFPVDGEGFGNAPGALEEVELVAALLRIRAQQDPELQSRLPSDEEALRAVVGEGWWEVENQDALLAGLGVYRYDCDDGWAVPYRRCFDVATPIRVAELSPEVGSSGRVVLVYDRKEGTSRAQLRRTDEHLVQRELVPLPRSIVSRDRTPRPKGHRG